MSERQAIDRLYLRMRFSFCEKKESFSSIGGPDDRAVFLPDGESSVVKVDFAVAFQTEDMGQVERNLAFPNSFQGVPDDNIVVGGLYPKRRKERTKKRK